LPIGSGASQTVAATAAASRHSAFNVKRITLAAEPASYAYDGDRGDCRRSTAPKATLDIRFAERMEAKLPRPAGVSGPAGPSLACPLVPQRRPRLFYRSRNDDPIGRGMSTSI
jgi:hypothetical protein